METKLGDQNGTKGEPEELEEDQNGTQLGIGGEKGEIGRKEGNGVVEVGEDEEEEGEGEGEGEGEEAEEDEEEEEGGDESAVEEC